MNDTTHKIADIASRVVFLIVAMSLAGLLYYGAAKLSLTVGDMAKSAVLGGN